MYKFQDIYKEITISIFRINNFGQNIYENLTYI